MFDFSERLIAALSLGNRYMTTTAEEGQTDLSTRVQPPHATPPPATVKFRAATVEQGLLAGPSAAAHDLSPHQRRWRPRLP
jgi:hypothetical protein